MRVVKTANNLPTMFVLERVESDPEYDQLKSELYDLGDYVSMRCKRPCFVHLRQQVCPTEFDNDNLSHMCPTRHVSVQPRSWPCIHLGKVLETSCRGSGGNRQ